MKNPATSCMVSSTVRNSIILLISSLTPQQAAGLALAVAVQLSRIAQNRNFLEIVGKIALYFQRVQANLNDIKKAIGQNKYFC